jgi:hypothetical protein
MMMLCLAEYLTVLHLKDSILSALPGKISREFAPVSDELATGSAMYWRHASDVVGHI